MYTVLFLSSTVLSSYELEKWLNERYAEGLRLVAVSGSSYIFERNISKPVIYQDSGQAFKFHEHNTPD